MFRLKIKPVLLSIALLLFISFLTSSCLLLRYLPDNKISIALFKVVYDSPISKKSFLEFYSPVRASNRGYIPVEVNQFLIQRLNTTNKENEFSAMVYFYALQASGHRLDYINDISEEAKIKVINQLIKDLNEESTFKGTLMLLEELRTNKSLGKGSVEVEGINHPVFSSIKESGKWLYEQSAPVAMKKYQEWWNSDLSWEEKKLINPLKDTNIKVSECCG